MASHRRVKDIAYDDAELYSDDEEPTEQEDTYTPEDRQNFATLTPVVRAHLDEAGLSASNREIEDALWYYYWDVGKSVEYLKGGGAAADKQQQQQQASSHTPAPAKKDKDKGKSKFEQALEKSAAKAGGATKSTLDSTKPKPQSAAHGAGRQTSGSSRGAETSSVPVAPPKAKTQGPPLKVVDLWQKARKTQKPFGAFVVIGHVDHGKSTLMGRLLLDTGAVRQRDIDKFRKQAAEMGKESFALAWVMDTGSEERERGVTVDIAQHHFSTERADFTILDAPGHRDFVPSMIGGASMADMAVLVVDANQLDSGMKGQTREHIQLAFGVGIRRIVVAVNKLDSANPPWSQDLFDTVTSQVMHLLTEVGFADDRILFVPCSGLGGENVAGPADKDSPAGRIRGGHPSLVSGLETFAYDDAAHHAKSQVQSDSPSQQTDQEAAIRGKQLRMQVADVYRGGIQNPLSVSGRITAGHVAVGQTVVIQPSGDQAVVKAIDVADDSRDWAVAFQIAALHLDGDLDTLNRNLRAGDLVCSAAAPVRPVASLTAKVTVLDTILPQGVDVHFGRAHFPASVRRLVETLDANGDTLKKTPRSLKAGQTARVEVALQPSAPIEAGDRLILRSGGVTLAVAVVESTRV